MFKGLKKKGGGNSANPAALLEHPMVQDVLQKAAHLRSDLRDQIDERVSSIAKRLKLPTRGEVKLLKRQVRELENQVSNLEHQLTHERTRADKADGALADTARQAKKAQDALSAGEAQLKTLETELGQLKAAASAAEKAAKAATPAPKAKAPADKTDDKAEDKATKADEAEAKAPASRKASRPKKKAEDGSDAADSDGDDEEGTLL